MKTKESFINKEKLKNKTRVKPQEQNALMDCAKRGVSCEGCTAYITHYPCIICARLLLAGGIKKINYLNDYKNDELVEKFTEQCHVEVFRL